ncbi:MAG: VCBS repeat-containing protein [Deltaproteobacteria bacterium]|nr:VCBS repeat-containing protein [Deltaproteobacteria bacterium]MBW2419988.1 VCBS repeat-containing protein [Deltaproteobacteria bacterium]
MAGLCRGAALALLSLGLTGCDPPEPPESSPGFAQATNVGTAHLENKSSAKAIEAFEEALGLAPDSPVALRNLARAHLLARDAAEADAVLTRALTLDADSAATHYLSGITAARESRFEEALMHLEAAARLDPHTAAVRFQLAMAYQAVGQHADATLQLHETVRLDRLHTAAHYRLAGYARRAGDRDELERRQRELVRLRNLLGELDRSAEALERCVYSLAETPPAPAPPPAAPAPAVRFLDASESLPSAARWVSAAVLEVDALGRYTLVVVGRDGGIGLLRPNADGAFEVHLVDTRVPSSILSRPPLLALAGNFHDTLPPGTHYDPASHPRNDVLILSPGGALLLEQGPGGTLADATARAGLSRLAGRAARWLDYDHDGDLDLAVAHTSGIALWQNGGDGRFEDVTTEVGLTTEGAVTDLAAVDLDGDVAVDLVLARGDAATLVFENQRTGHYAAQLAPPGPWPAASRVLIDEFDGDGRPDAALIGETELLVLSAAGGPPQRLALGKMTPTAAATIDYDNDGRLDLFVGGTGGDGSSSALRLFRNQGGGHWSRADAMPATGTRAAAVERALVADLDDDGDSDLLLMSDAGLQLLRNEGGNAGVQLKVRLLGSKTNPAGIGTQVEVRAAGFRAQRAVQEPFVELGLGKRRTLDSVQTVWTNGVVDNQIGVSVRDEPLTIVEKNVAAGSCPFLYAWNGKGYRFVTDLLGNSPVGLSRRRGEVLGADPDELVYVGGVDDLPPQAGAYSLELTSEFREVLYLDHARLVAVDHAPGMEVHPSDRLMPPPFPPSELWALHEGRVPRSAIGSDGIDRSSELQAIDGLFAPPGTPRPPPLRGQTEELVLTLDFGALGEPLRPVLALTGWLQYGDASTNIAMSQNQSLSVLPPTLEAETPGGHWVPLDVVVGMPAGKTKTIVIPLTGKLPAGTGRLRLRTTFELRWDRIALFERLPDSVLEVNELAPIAADLRHRGYSEIRSRSPGHPTTPDYDTVRDRPPWRTTPEGWVTRFGDVLELVAARDARLAIVSGGDALALRFAAALPAPAQGRTRTFFLYSVGWDKDADHNVVNGETVGPLPVTAAPGDDYRVRYNTRWVPRDQPVRAP